MNGKTLVIQDPTHGSDGYFLTSIRFELKPINPFTRIRYWLLDKAFEIRLHTSKDNCKTNLMFHNFHFNYRDKPYEITFPTPIKIDRDEGISLSAHPKKGRNGRYRTKLEISYGF